MIITLFCIGLCILAFILKNVYYKINNIELGDICLISEFIAGMIGGIGTFICIIIIILTHAGKTVQIEQNQIEYESLCDRLEIINSDYEDVSKATVIADIAEWNSGVTSAKYWGNNPWTNWFYSKEVIDKLQYIEINK